MPAPLTRTTDADHENEGPTMPPAALTATSPTTAASVSAPSLTTLVGVELRTFLDTRSTIATLALAALTGVVVGGAQTLRPGTSTLGEVVGMVLLFAPYVLVGLGAALVTGEYRHRTTLGTFARVPRRGRVLAAKAGAAVVLALCTALLASVAGALIGAAVPMAGIPAIDWALDGSQVLLTSAGLISAALIGWALGMATGSLAITLAAFLIWPLVTTLVSGFSPAAGRLMDWTSPDALYALADGVTATTVGQSLTSLTLWIVLPAVVGWIRLTKGEVR